MKRPDLVDIGRVKRAHGVKGLLLVESLSDNPNRFKELASVLIELKDEKSRHVVESCKQSAKGWLVKLEDVNDRDQADQLKGALLKIEAADLPELEEGTYYDFDLIGLDVFSIEGDKLGTITEIEHYPANDAYVVTGDKGTLRIPATRDVVKNVDLDNKRMEVQLLSGLEFE